MQRCQRLVDALARQAHQVGQLLLRDAQHFAHPRVKRPVEQRRQAARHAHIGVVQPVNGTRCNELAQTLIELVHDKTVEAQRMVQQPIKGVDRQSGHSAFAQRLHVVAVGLALDHRALAKPAPRRQSGKGHGAAVGVVAAHLEQALDHAEPVRHRLALATDTVAHLCVGHAQRFHGALALVRLQVPQPWDTGHFVGLERAAALLQWKVLGHGSSLKNQEQGKCLQLSAQAGQKRMQRKTQSRRKFAR